VKKKIATPTLMIDLKKSLPRPLKGDKPPKPVTPTVFMLLKILTEMYCSHQYLSIDSKKVCHAQTATNFKKS